MSDANRDEDFVDWFCDLATQYYVAARLAAKAQLVPIHGNLFHHAVEMFLKCALVGVLTIEEMRSNEYGHKLLPLWRRFKKREDDPALDRFDAAIAALHDFESIRYPDRIVKQGMLVSISWEPGDVGPTTGTAKMPPKYEVAIQDIDRLIIEVLHRASRNPESVRDASDAFARTRSTGPSQPRGVKVAVTCWNSRRITRAGRPARPATAPFGETVLGSPSRCGVKRHKERRHDRRVQDQR